MKTFFVVSIYATMVAALDLGGAVWNSLHVIHRAKTATVTTVTGAAAPAKTVNAVRAPATIPSGT